MQSWTESVLLRDLTEEEWAPYDITDNDATCPQSKS
jgi:hypothetical protein